jgi:putative ABC transport system permease protein
LRLRDVTIAYNSSAAEDAEFGSANSLLRFDGADAGKLEAALAATRDRFGTIEVIGHRSLRVPGSVDPVEFRSQDPRGPYGDPSLALLRGRYPQRAGGVAVTDGVATLLGLEIGDPLALDGGRRTVVGIVENPRDLSDEFALVSPSSAGAPDHVTVLVDADANSLDTFMDGPADSARFGFAGTEARQSNRGADTLAMFSVATVFLLLAHWLPPPALPSSRSDGCASSARSRRSALPRSTSGSCC